MPSTPKRPDPRTVRHVRPSREKRLSSDSYNKKVLLIIFLTASIQREFRTTMENLRNMKIPQGSGPGRLAQIVVIGGAAIYGLTHSLFNVEGGHRWGFYFFFFIFIDCEKGIRRQTVAIETSFPNLRPLRPSSCTKIQWVMLSFFCAELLFLIE